MTSVTAGVWTFAKQLKHAKVPALTKAGWLAHEQKDPVSQRAQTGWFVELPNRMSRLYCRICVVVSRTTPSARAKERGHLDQGGDFRFPVTYSRFVAVCHRGGETQVEDVNFKFIWEDVEGSENPRLGQGGVAARTNKKIPFLSARRRGGSSHFRNRMSRFCDEICVVVSRSAASARAKERGLLVHARSHPSLAKEGTFACFNCFANVQTQARL